MKDNALFNPLAIEHVIKSRETLKVLGDANNPVVFSNEITAKNKTIVIKSLQIAGWAPFHYPRHEKAPKEPWRAYVLWHDTCQKIAKQLFDWCPDLSENHKIPRMLYACGALVLATWLPEHTDENDSTQKQQAKSKRNEEHLAASAAMVQNLLLMLTSHNMGTYWSSGGLLGEQSTFEKLGISAKESLLAAVFIEYPQTLGDNKTRMPGTHRQARSEQWIEEICF